MSNKKIEERAVSLALKLDEWWGYVWLIGVLLQWGEPFLDLPEGRRLKQWLDDCEEFYDGCIVALEEFDRARIKARKEAGPSEREVKRIQERFRTADERGRSKIIQDLFQKADSLFVIVEREAQNFLEELKSSAKIGRERKNENGC
ncbi:MAG: hypothetical protein FJ044_03305 [Candidatus Cloacimonetes bacterium]|nr:hypothetical protein [Candidatus Cloacimonadota bacterium]